LSTQVREVVLIELVSLGSITEYGIAIFPHVEKGPRDIPNFPLNVGRCSSSQKYIYIFLE